MQAKQCIVIQDYVLVAGSLQGELSIFSPNEALPIYSTVGLGAISLVKCGPLPGLQDPVIYVFTIEGQLHVFSLKSDVSMRDLDPLLSVEVACNVAACVIGDVDGDGRDELLVGTSDGVMVCWRYDSSRDEPFNRIKYWQLQYDITSLELVHDHSHSYIYIGQSDGLFATMMATGNDNPERLGTKNFISEKLGELGASLFLSKVVLGHMIAVNGFGKMLYLSEVSFKSGKMSATIELQVTITKIPIFAEIMCFEGEAPVGVIGCSDGTIFFLSPSIWNYTRYEEVVTAYCVGTFTCQSHQSMAVAVAGRSKRLAVFYDLAFLSVCDIQNKLPNFITTAREELEDLRKLLSTRYVDDLQTSSAELIETYLYMPLPET